MTPLRWLLDLVRGAHPDEFVMLAMVAGFVLYIIFGD